LEKAEEYLRQTGPRLIEEINTRNPSLATMIHPNDINQIYYTGENEDG